MLSRVLSLALYPYPFRLFNSFTLNFKATSLECSHFYDTCPIPPIGILAGRTHWSDPIVELHVVKPDCVNKPVLFLISAVRVCRLDTYSPYLVRKSRYQASVRGIPYICLLYTVPILTWTIHKYKAFSDQSLGVHGGAPPTCQRIMEVLHFRCDPELERTVSCCDVL